MTDAGRNQKRKQRRGGGVKAGYGKDRHFKGDLQLSTKMGSAKNVGRSTYYSWYQGKRKWGYQRKGIHVKKSRKKSGDRFQKRDILK